MLRCYNIMLITDNETRAEVQNQNLCWIFRTEIINYHLHFDFTVFHPFFFCPAMTDVDVRAVLGVRSVDPVTTLG